jgi:flavodoxin I
MKKTALIYSFNSIKTAAVAKKIEEYFSGAAIELVNIENIDDEKFQSFQNYIIGVPTWFDGELPNYWDELVPAIEDMDLSEKYFAIFGLGDQVGYPENFCDAIGIMAELLEKQGASIIGSYPLNGYTFEYSKAEVNGKFVGLPLDQENQGEQTNQRIKLWINELKQLFK